MLRRWEIDKQELGLSTEPFCKVKGELSVFIGLLVRSDLVTMRIRCFKGTGTQSNALKKWRSFDNVIRLSAKVDLLVA